MAVWVITGASSGVGREIALAALGRGDTVAALGRHDLDDLKQRGCHTSILDLSKASASDFHNLVNEIVARLGGIDILVNAAGYILEGCIEECR